MLHYCWESDIFFICLLPNLTHLCQPLDVAVFRPAKIEWRDILDTWRKESRCADNLPKVAFPSLLSKLMKSLKPKNMISGFRACGIFPFCPQEVLKRLPDMNNTEEVDKFSFNESVLEVLKENCGVGVEKRKRQTKRGKKVTLGKRVTGFTSDEDEENIDADVPSSSRGKQKKKKQKRTKGLSTTASDIVDDDDLWSCKEFAGEWGD